MPIKTATNLSKMVTYLPIIRALLKHQADHQQHRAKSDSQITMHRLLKFYCLPLLLASCGSWVQRQLPGSR